MKFAWIAFVTVVIALSASRCCTAQTWEHYPGFRDPGVAGIAIGDYDGNGRPEAAITATSEAGRVIGLLGPDASGTYAMRNVVVLPFSAAGAIVPAPPEDGADRLAVIVGDYSPEGHQVAILGGIPLRMLRTVDVPVISQIDSILDVDGDGQAEIMAKDGGFGAAPRILDYASGAVEWIGPEGASILATAQLDDDAGLELVLGGFVEPGRIIDGLTHVEEWFYPVGFPNRVAAGRFPLGAPSGRGFATADDALVQLFRSQPWTPVSEFTVADTVTVIASLPLDGSGGDYIAVGTLDCRLDIHDPVTGARLFSLGDADDPSMAAVTSIATGDLAGDGGRTIVFNAGLGSSGKREVRVADLSSQATEFVQVDDQGPYSAVVRGDIGADGGDEIAYVTHYSSGEHEGQVLRVLAAGDGHVLRQRTLATSEGFSHLALAQLDADPPLEIVVVGGSYSEIAVLDGASLLDQWRLTSNALDYQHFNDLAMRDVNGDGFDDVLATAGDQLHAFNGRNGTRVWTPVVVGGMGAMRVAAFQLPSGRPGAIVAHGVELHVFDLATRTDLAQAMAASDILGLAAWNEEAECNAGVLEEYRLVVRRCSDLLETDTLPVPVGTTFFRPLDSSGNRFLMAARGYLMEVGRSGVVTTQSGLLGARVGEGNMGVVQSDGDGLRADIVIGSDVMVTRRQVLLDLVFGDGFD
jgi:hypothetical protein